ncbi:tetratricopeptide repeat protein [Nocardia puris]|uniref:tetratricopeptide repeat protein n=1 Tax=Nocardia puris TaxID=208602 RepID=UPI0018931856|nr:tetratricopeptide repeat protein [Nocardia puris]MBF6211292.1 tetratricopeptide repeat protein [Nocardia puris]
MNRRGEGGVSADERRRLRQVLLGLGLTEHQLLEPLAGELRQRGYRPRAAWRHANGFTQNTVARRFNELTDSARAAMKASRISEYESWPLGTQSGARPTLRVLKVLAAVYGTTWDQLVDVADLAHMPEADLEEYHDAVARRAVARQPVPTGGDLPAEVPHFTGRENAKDLLRQRVREHVRGGAVSVHVIVGLTGIGKTALARYAVSAFEKHYPDGTIWFDLHGYTLGREPREPADVLEQLLLQIGVPRESIEADLAGRANQWRTAMSDRRMLVVFDNVLDSAQVKDLLPQAPGCFVLVTSRGKLTGLAYAAPLRLDVMGWDEAEELLVKLAGLGPGYDRQAVRQILQTAGRLPLAIRLIGGQIAHHGEEMLADTAAEIVALTERIKRASAVHVAGESGAAHLLDRFTAEDESLRAAFEVSYQRLRDPTHQRAVRLLGWFPGPEITADTMAAMADVAPAEANALVRKLFESGFLDRSSGGADGQRYRMHDLTRLCARMHAEREDPPGWDAVVLDRLVQAGLEIARRASTHQVFDPSGGEHLSSHSVAAERARAWLTQEREMLQSCVQAAEPTAAAAELARRVASHLTATGYWSSARRLFARALRIAGEVGDRGAESWALVGQGRVDRLFGHHAEAGAGFERALAIAAELGDEHTRAAVLCELGQTARSTGDHGVAQRYFGEALELSRRIGNRPAECDALHGLAHVFRAASDYGAASRHSERALAIATEIGDAVRVATAQWGLAEVVRRLGDHETASELYQEALSNARKMNHRKLEGDALRGLGHIERLVGDQRLARRNFEDALRIACRIHDRYGEGWTRWGLGNIARKDGDYDEARAMFQQAYDIAVEIADPLGQVDALRGLGHVERHFDEYDRARRFYTESMDIAHRIGDPLGQADAYRALAHLAARNGAPREAEALRTRALDLYESIGMQRVDHLRGQP